MSKNLRIIVVTSFLLTPLFLKAQRYSLELSPAIGRHFANDVQPDRSGRIGLSLSGYVTVAKYLQIGAAILWTSRIRSPVSFYDTYDPVTGVRIVEPTFNTSTSQFIMGKYSFKSQGYPIVFSALRVGVTTLTFKEGTAEGKRTLAKRRNFSISPEIGVRFTRNISVSICYLQGGKTPAYHGLDFNQSPMSLRSIKINPILMACTYQLSF